MICNSSIKYNYQSINRVLLSINKSVFHNHIKNFPFQYHNNLFLLFVYYDKYMNLFTIGVF